MAKDLLANVIAEAKQVKETAMANAKLALEEAFQPTLQRMISSRIAEEDGEEDLEGEVDIDVMGAEDAPVEDEGGDMGFGSFEDEPAEEEPVEGEGDDLELEALIRELDGEEDYEDPMMEEEDCDEDYMGEGEEDSWQDPIDDLETDPVMEGDEIDDMELEEALDALLREEEGLGDMLDMGQNKEDGSVYDENPPSGNQFLERRKLRTENKRLKANLNEAYRAVTTLKKTLNEVNLLNAKLMYTTKTLRSYPLNEAQQQRILDSFDRATSVREVKLVFATIAQSMNKKPIKRVSEGSASKSVKAINPSTRRLTENRDIVDKALVARFQNLANINRREDF